MTKPATSTLLDPLLATRRVVGWMLGVQLLLGGVDLVAILDGQSTVMSLLSTMSGILLSAGLLKHVLPRYPPDVILLRSFQADRSKASAHLRRTLETAAHPWRVAGVREPGRRWPAILRPLLHSAFVWTYAANRRMNLESGMDWRERLLHSLVCCRAVVVDYREPTSFVTEELGMALAQAGAARLWVVTGPQTPDDEMLSACRTAGAQVQMWTDDAQRQRETAASFVDFLRGLPDSHLPLNVSLLDEVRERSGYSTKHVAWRTRLDRWLYWTGWCVTAVIWLVTALTVGGGAFAWMSIGLALIGFFSTGLALVWSWEHAARRRLHKRLPSTFDSIRPQWPYLLWLANLPVLIVLGSSTATSVGAYNEYIVRSRVVERFGVPLSAVHTAVTVFHAEHQRLPERAELQALVDSSVTDPGAVKVVDGRTIEIHAGDGAPSQLSRLVLHAQFDTDGEHLVRRCQPSDPQAKALVRSYCGDQP